MGLGSKCPCRGRTLTLLVSMVCLLIAFYSYTRPGAADKLRTPPHGLGSPSGNYNRYAQTEMMGRGKLQANLLPKAMIVGVKKCGTGTLYDYTHFHPNVSIIREQIFYLHYSEEKGNATDWWNHIPSSRYTMIPMAAASRFLHDSLAKHSEVPAFIFNEHMKFVVIIRDPVVRAISDYAHMLIILENKGQLSQFPITYKGNEICASFRETVLDKDGKVRQGQNLIQRGEYINNFRLALEVYRREQFLIIDGQAFTEDPFPSMVQIERFLGLPRFYKRKYFRKNPQTGFFCSYMPGEGVKCANPLAKGRQHPTVDNKTLTTLYDYYRPLNQQLATELRLDFNWLK